MAKPFVNDPRYRLKLAYSLVPKATKTLLDYGCGDGLLLRKLEKKIPRAQLVGYDVDGTLPKEKNYFDVVCLLDVLEHVPSEDKVLDWIYKALKPGGMLLFSTPHKGLTEIFDPGNIKFRFPVLHKIIYQYLFRQKGYEEKYQKSKLVGDVSRQKEMWHRHYSDEDLKNLLNGKFKIERVYYYALFFPILSMLDQAIKWIFARRIKILEKLILLDSRKNFGSLSFSIFIKAIKVKA